METCYLACSVSGPARAIQFIPVDFTLFISFQNMEKNIQKWSLPLGMASLGSSALIQTTISFQKGEITVYFMLFALAAGLFQANAIRFFGGLALAVLCFCAYSTIGMTEREHSFAGILFEFIFALVFSLAAIPFFAGFLLRRIAKAFKARRDARQITPT